MTKIEWFEVAIKHGFALTYQDFEVMIVATGLGYSMEAIKAITEK